VAVDTALRGTGLGVALTWDRIIEARRRGLRSLWLLTTTAAAFFPRLGFQRVDRVDAPPDIQASPEFATVCPSTAVCMQLPLG
jgi:amino-acid N-acetyltransferase